MAVNPVSFTRTPQAGDDAFNLTEDQITTYAADVLHTHVMSLDVMSNDLGGNAKKLYSIDDGNGNPLASDAQLLVQDVGSNGISAWEATDQGNAIRINNGRIEFDLSHSLTALGATDVNSLAGGDVINDTFVYTIQLGNGTLSQAVVRVHIVGVNDVASITGDHDGSVTEDGTLSDTGTLVVTDADHGQSHSQPVIASAHNSDAGLGSYSVDANGHWNYTVDNALIQHLGANAHAQDTFRVVSQDGSASQLVTIDIVGVNDTASISGNSNGSVTEDGTLLAAATLAVSDVDDNEAHSQTVVASAHNSDAGLGSYSVDADGHWNYTVDNALIQHLGANAHAQDTFHVVSQDGSASQVVTIDIVGANDTASVSGDSSGSVTEDGTLLAGGTLTVSDVDDNEAHSQTVVASAHNSDGGLGSYSVDADGHWSYTVDNALIQHLGANVHGQDTFSVASLDGSASQVVTIDIVGVNDTATITGDTTGSVTEDTSTSAQGTLSVADVDDGESGFQAVANAALHGTYGDFTFDESSGAWTYALRNGDANVQALRNSDHVTDTLTVHSTDGTAQDITVHVNGTDDVATSAVQNQAFNFSFDPPQNGNHSSSFVLGGPNDAFHFTGTLDLTVTGDINRASEQVHLTFENGNLVNFTQGTGGPGDPGDPNSVSVGPLTASFTSTDNTITFSYGTTNNVGTAASHTDTVTVAGTVHYTYDFFV